MLHLIPDDELPHAPTTECGCGPRAEMVTGPDGTKRLAIVHPAAETQEGGDGDGWTGCADEA